MIVTINIMYNASCIIVNGTMWVHGNISVLVREKRIVNEWCGSGWMS